MHQLQEIDRQILNTQLETNYGGKWGYSVTYYVAGNLFEFDKRRIKVNVDKIRKGFA